MSGTAASSYELLASSVDLSTTPLAAGWIREHGAEPDRFGPDAATAGGRAPKADNELQVCPTGAGCDLTLHVQDNEIVKVTSPHDDPVTHGNLCIKGRFGFQHVQNRD